MRNVILWYLCDRWYLKDWLTRFGFPGPEVVSRRDFLNLRDAMIRNNAYGARHNRWIRNDMIGLFQRAYRLRFPNDE